MTLTEILVATMLVGIVMLGAVSVDYAVRSARKSASQDSSLSIRTQATLVRITRDASAAVGDFSSPGIDDTTGGALCMRKELGGDLNTYDDDQWICYWKSVTKIYRCERTIAAGPGACATSDAEVGTVCSAASCFTYDFVLDLPSAQIYLDVSLTGRTDPSQTFHAINNPEYTASTRVYPAGHGF